MAITFHIDAEPEVVFDYFTQPDALVRWMGDRAFPSRVQAANSR